MGEMGWDGRGERKERRSEIRRWLVGAGWGEDLVGLGGMGWDGGGGGK